MTTSLGEAERLAAAALPDGIEDGWELRPIAKSDTHILLEYVPSDGTYLVGGVVILVDRDKQTATPMAYTELILNGFIDTMTPIEAG